MLAATSTSSSYFLLLLKTLADVMPSREVGGRLSQQMLGHGAQTLMIWKFHWKSKFQVLQKPNNLVSGVSSNVSPIGVPLSEVYCVGKVESEENI